MPLPLRIRPIPEESLQGFVMRLAERNAHRTPISLLKRADKKVRNVEQVSFGKVCIPALAELAAVPTEVLEALVYAQVDSRFRFFRGNSLHQDHFYPQPRRACPLCLAENPFHRAIWDLSTVTVCPVHKVRLISGCMTCGRKLGWRMVPLYKCRCGADIRKMPCAPVPEENLAGTSAVLRLLGMQSGSYPDVFRTISANDGISLIASLGWFIHFHRGRPNFQAMPAYVDTPRLLSDGYSACSDWPTSFQGFMERLQQGANDRPGRYGVLKQLGPLAEWLKVAPLGIRNLLLDEVQRHFGSRCDLARRRGTTFDDGNSAYIPIAQAARLIGIEQLKMRNVLIRRGLTAQPFGGGKGVPIMVDRTKIEEIAEDYRNLVLKVHVRPAIGCSRKIADAILDAGFIPEAKKTIALEVFGRRAWDLRDVAEFIQRLERKSKNLHDVEAIALPKAFASYKRGGLTSFDVIDAILQDALEVVGIDGAAVGLNKILVDAKLAHAFRKKQPRKTSASTLRKRIECQKRKREKIRNVHEDAISVSDVAVLLNVKINVVCDLVGAGLLKTLTPELKRRWRFSYENVLEFQSKYIFATQIHGQTGWLAVRAVQRLIAGGFQPVSGAKVDGRLKYVFERASVEAIPCCLP